MPIVGVVADANALLSAIVGKAALPVITEFNIETQVSQFNVEEVAEYLPRMSKKYGLPVALVELQWKLLPLHIHTVSDYESLLPRAIADMKRRDPEDAHPLALARSLAIPIWSNDRDFDNVNVECYSTARLLRLLGEQKRPRG
jgi:predicted nucleic acid-binding protein